MINSLNFGGEKIAGRSIQDAIDIDTDKCYILAFCGCERELQPIDSSVFNCAGVISCIENAATLDLSSVIVTLWEICWSITFCAWGVTIDRTNTTNTGEQNFDDWYIANYTDSVLNYLWTTESNYWEDTVNNYSWTQNFDATSITNFLEDSVLNLGWEINYLATSITSWTQNFDSNYTANYDWSAINILNWAAFDITDSVYTSSNNSYTYDWDTVLYTGWSILTYDGTTTLNLLWITNISNLNITNIVIPAGGEFALATLKTTNTSAAYKLAMTSIAALTDELTFIMEPHVANLANATLEINALWAKTLKNMSWNNLKVNDLLTTWRYRVTYDIWTDTFIVWSFVKSDTDIKRVSSVAWAGPSVSLVVTDTDCTVNSVIMWRTVTAGSVSWFRQFTVWAGSFQIDSTASETWLTFNYVIYK